MNHKEAFKEFSKEIHGKMLVESFQEYNNLYLFVSHAFEQARKDGLIESLPYSVMRNADKYNIDQASMASLIGGGIEQMIEELKKAKGKE